MNKQLRFITVLFLTLSINSVLAGTISGRVVGVTDGDTITVLDNTDTQYKVRLAGIDAPEKKQPFGYASKQSLSDLVYGKQVSIDWEKLDRYERVVGKIFVNGVNVNLEQVKKGMAWYYKKYQNELVLADRLDYLHGQETAQKEKVGLWIDDEPEAPWDFRKSRR